MMRIPVSELCYCWMMSRSCWPRMRTCQPVIESITNSFVSHSHEEVCLGPHFIVVIRIFLVIIVVIKLLLILVLSQAARHKRQCQDHDHPEAHHHVSDVHWKESWSILGKWCVIVITSTYRASLSTWDANIKWPHHPIHPIMSVRGGHSAEAGDRDHASVVRGVGSIWIVKSKRNREGVKMRELFLRIKVLKHFCSEHKQTMLSLRDI